jgi:tetratricopeptide (TPR) repeat protein
MKDKKRFDRKELKEPDEFVHFWTRVIQVTTAHKREFLIGTSGLLLLVLIAVGVRACFENREEEAQDLLAKVRALLPSSATADPLTGMRVQKPTGPEREQEAMSALKEIVADYGGTLSGQQSRLLLGQIYYDRGDYDAALRIYEEFLQKGEGPPEMQALAWEGLAYVREAKGEYELAIPWYDDLTRTDLSYVKPWAWMGMARCYEQTGEKEKALEAYRRLVADYPQQERAEEARARIAILSPRVAGEPAGNTDRSDAVEPGEMPDAEKGP